MEITKNGMLIVRRNNKVVTVQANADFTKRVMKNNYKNGESLYLHIRDNGAVYAYIENDYEKSIYLDIQDREYILKEVADFR